MEKRELIKNNTEIEEFSDFRGLDLSNSDLRDIEIKVLQTTQFDTNTIWPDKERLPIGFNPEELMERGKNPGLGIKELHSEGIDGRGVVLAVIDQNLDIDHPEYKDSLIDHREYSVNEEGGFSFHGSMVTSALVGKESGVAPGAKLIYKAMPGGTNWALWANALDDIVEYNRHADEKTKIRIVSCSSDYNLNSEEDVDADKWDDSINRAKQAGIFIIDAGGKHTKLDYTGGGSVSDKEDFEEYEEFLFSRQDRDLLSKGTDEVIKELRAHHKKYDDISDGDMVRFIEEKKVELKNNDEIIIPSDYRTFASSYNEPGGYVFQGRGGISWATPYLAGVLAMALQIKPNIKLEEFSKIVKDTVVTNKKGLKIINPKGIVEKVKKLD